MQLPVVHAKLGVIKQTPTAEQRRSYIVTVGNKDYRRNRRNLLVLEPTWKADSQILEQVQKVAELVIGTPTQTIKQVVVARSGRFSKPVSRYQA